MLSKVIKSDEINDEKMVQFVIPSKEQLNRVIEKRKMEYDRKEIIDSNPNDLQNAARQEAEKILSEAQEKLKSAELEVIKKKQEIEQQTRQEMQEQLNLRMSEEINSVKTRLVESLQGLVNCKETIYRESEESLMDLVFSICAKVIGDEVKNSKDIVLSLLRNGFSKIKNSKVNKIILNPKDFEVLVGNQEALLKEVKNSDEIRFEKDESIERGGCIIKTLQGEMSTEPLKQLEVIKDEFKQNV